MSVLADVTYRVFPLLRAQTLTGGGAAVLTPRFPMFGASAVLFSAKCSDSTVPATLAFQAAMSIGGTLLASGNAGILDNWGSLPNLTTADMSLGYVRAVAAIDQAPWGALPFLTWAEMVFSITPNAGATNTIDVDAIVIYGNAPRDGGGRTTAGAAFFKDLTQLGILPT